MVFNPKVNYTTLIGRQSIKAGYEFQRINTEVQDVNPLYGLDVYASSFTRPATAAANNLYNLADFMLGLRSQYALSNVLVANLRQDMHFLYLQDDVRMSNKLTLNLGLRYEYATPQWERDNILTNWDPDARTMIQAKDGSIYDRALVDPDRNNWGPRLGFAYTMTPKTVLRGGWGVSYVHFNRAGGGNILAINSPQVINAVAVQGNALAPTFRTTQEGYRLDLPIRRSSARSWRTSPTCPATIIRRRCRAGISQCSARLAPTWSSMWRMSAIVPKTCCSSRTTTRRSRIMRRAR